MPAFAEGAEDMGPILTDSEICRSPALAGKRKCSYFCDDAIWALRDVTRHAQRSLFDHPFFSVLRECHEKYGLTAQINLFYRTDFFYGMDEFTLADVTDAYREEFRANADWLKFGFHSLQEFPDYPWINANYGDVKKLFEMIRSEVVRFAGEESFAYACVPHWCPMSKDGVRALKDCGIRVMRDPCTTHAQPVCQETAGNDRARREGRAVHRMARRACRNGPVTLGPLRRPASRSGSGTAG